MNRIAGIQGRRLQCAHQVVVDANRNGGPDPRHTGPQSLPVFLGPHPGHADTDGGRIGQAGFQRTEMGLELGVGDESQVGRPGFHTSQGFSRPQRRSQRHSTCASAFDADH
jgi:hypothetical protein